MTKVLFTYLFIAIVVMIICYSCIKRPNYPTTPTIEYKGFRAFSGDSADLQISFTDGNGDIGVGANDSTRTFWYTYYYKDSVNQPYTGYAYTNLTTNQRDTLRIGYVVRSPADSYKGKPISGEINIRLQQFRHLTEIKHVKYVFYLLDASGNKSNVVTSPEI
ncbi:MAG: hypothetical protein V4580_14375, partial [Bacteroidota bacterium]